MQVCRALSAAHERGIVHRDLKPGNVFLCDDGTAKVLDFGMSKFAAAETLTQEGYTLGTPEYMAPEQCIGATVEPRTDLYAFGVLMYEALAGELPILARSRRELLELQQRYMPPPLRDRRPDLEIPEALDRAIMKTLRNRSSSARRARLELEHMLSAIPTQTLLRSYPPGTVKAKSWPSARWTQNCASSPSSRRSLGAQFVILGPCVPRSSARSPPFSLASPSPFPPPPSRTSCNAPKRWRRSRSAPTGASSSRRSWSPPTRSMRRGARPSWPGQRLEIPAVGHLSHAPGDTWQSLAKQLLGDPERATVLSQANDTMPWVLPAEGAEIIGAVQLALPRRANDTIVSIALKFNGEKEKAWMLDQYNHLKGQPVHRGDWSCSLDRLPLTEAGKAEAALEDGAVRTQAAGQARDAQRKVDAEIPCCSAMCGAGATSTPLPAG